MAYFNHAFQKTILAVDGQITTANKMLWELNDLAVDSTTSAQKAMFAIVGTDGTDKDKIMTGDGSKPFMIAGTTLRPKDKIGKFMGGFQSLNTSKKINPKYINDLYYVLPQSAKNAYAIIGGTESTSESTTTVTPCDYAFECGKTYYLQLDVKGNAVASVLMHNYHKRVPAFVSCCNVDDPDTTTVETAVNTIAIYFEWAKYIKNDPMTEGIVEPIIYAGATANALTAYTKDGITIGGVTTTKFGEENEAGSLAKGIKDGTIKVGYLKVVAAYEETVYGSCTFQANDGYELQPMEIQASMVDVNGDPCFNGVCIDIIKGQPKTRTGESLLREVILDESYHQRWMHSDLRKREIEGSGSLLNYIDSGSQYVGIYLLHSVPRFNNPSGTFDNDQYLIQIVCTEDNYEDIVDALETATGLTAIEYSK